MVLWADKYRPKQLTQLNLHPSVTECISKLTRTDDLPHLLFYGPAGGGKKTRVQALLREVFGEEALKVTVLKKTFKLKARKIEMATLTSSVHLEMTPADVGVASDRFVIQNVIKEMAQTAPVNENPEVKGKEQAVGFKVVVLHQVDRLSKSAQHALRRTMEKYSRCCRLILVGENLSRVIPPLQSRCLSVRVPLPTVAQVVSSLQDVARAESLQLPPELANRIAMASRRNLRRALLMLEACRAERYPFVSSQPVQGSADWERLVNEVAVYLTTGPPSVQKLAAVRERMLELLAACIPPEAVLRTLTWALLKRVDEGFKSPLAQAAALYEHRMQNGGQPIVHLEAFLGCFLSMTMTRLKSR